MQIKRVERESKHFSMCVTNYFSCPTFENAPSKLMMIGPISSNRITSPSCNRGISASGSAAGSMGISLADSCVASSACSACCWAAVVVDDDAVEVTKAALLVADVALAFSVAELITTARIEKDRNKNLILCYIQRMQQPVDAKLMFCQKAEMDVENRN